MRRPAGSSPSPHSPAPALGVAGCGCGRLFLKLNESPALLGEVDDVPGSALLALQAPPSGSILTTTSRRRSLSWTSKSNEPADCDDDDLTLPLIAPGVENHPPES